MDRKTELRKFGLVVGGVFAAIGAFLCWRGGWTLTLGTKICGGLGIGLIVPGLLFPLVLGPVFTVWMFLAHILGWINTRIILAAIFYTGFFLARIYLTLRGNDPMQRRPDPALATYWHDVSAREFEPKHHEHPF